MTVVTVTYNSAKVVRDLLASIPAAASDVPYRVVVVDNGSQDDSAEIVRSSFPNATLLQLENRGYAAGINAAVASCGDRDAVLIANPDIVLDPESIPRLLRVLDDGVGVAVPRLRDEHGQLLFSLRRDATLGRIWGEAVFGGRRARVHRRLSQVDGDPASYAHSHDVDWASGALLLVSRACWQATGEWDESFFLYCEEEEFQQRARAAGFVVRYSPDAGAVHIGGDMHAAGALWALGTVNKLRLYARSHGAAATAVFRIGLACNEMIRSRSSAHRRALRAVLGRNALTPGFRP